VGSYRIEKVNELMRQQIAEIIGRELEFGKGVMVTVLAAETSRDLLYGKIIVSVFPENKSAAALEILKKNVYDIQQILNRRLKMRPVPKIHFEISRQVAEADRIEKLIEETKK
jgi:ribosome-binding factor A